jgi:thiamine-monophosphate kinase
MKIGQLGERGLIRLIRESLGTTDPGVSVGIGDDSAVLSPTPGTRLLATTDLLIEEIHFRRRYAGHADIGWKAMAVNLSDIAAMGGIPRFALVALACPPETTVQEIEALYAGMRAAAEPHGVSIVGGDTSASPQGLIVNVTLIGQISGEPRLRSDARPGDLIAVTGSLGRAAAGLAVLEADPPPKLARELVTEVSRAHLRPTARVAEGSFFGQADGVRAMIDCSDGLVTDLGHLVTESAVGARVWLDRLPISPAVGRVAEALEQDPIAFATVGGEDYELLLSVTPAALPALVSGLSQATGTELTVIGEILPPEAGLRFVDAQGRPVALGEGFEHFSPEGRPGP